MLSQLSREKRLGVTHGSMVSLVGFPSGGYRMLPRGRCNDSTRVPLRGLDVAKSDGLGGTREFNNCKERPLLALVSS